MKIKKEWVLIGLFTILGGAASLGTTITNDLNNEKNKNELDNKLRLLETSKSELENKIQYLESKLSELED